MVLYTAAFWPQTVWTPGTADEPGCQTQRGTFFFSFLNYFSRQTQKLLKKTNKKKGHRGSRDTILTRCVHCGPKFESAFAKIWRTDCRLALGGAAAPRRVRGVPWLKKRWGGDFQDRSGKDCLKVKRFFAPRKSAEAETGRVSSFLRAGEGEWLKQTIFQHVYLERDDDNISVSHSLSWRVTLLLDGSIFLTLCKGSCQLQFRRERGDLQTRKLKIETTTTTTKKGSAFDVASL